MFWNHQAETLSRADMAVWQNHKISKVIERVYEKTVLYGRRIEESNRKPETIKTVEELAALPFTTKQDIADNYPYGLLTMPVSGVSYVHRSQADHWTMAVNYTSNDMAMWTELMARMLVAGGVNMTSVFQIAVNPVQCPESIAVHYGVRQMGATLVPASGDNLLLQIQLMEDFGVNAIFSTPSYMLQLSQELKKQGIQPRELPLQVIFCSMENSDAVQEVEKEYEVRVLQIYGLQDIFGMGIGGECCHGGGIHIQEDCFYPEVIHPIRGERLAVGETGELVLTSLLLEAMPLIRYRTGILGYLNEGPCACGRTMIRFNNTGKK